MLSKSTRSHWFWDLIGGLGTANLVSNFSNNGMTAGIIWAITPRFAVIPMVYVVRPPKQFI